VANRTQSALRAEVQARLAESGGGFYTDEHVNQWLNDGVRDIAIALEPLVTTSTRATTTGTGEYALPTDTISIKLVQYKDTSSNWFNLDEETYQNLLTLNPTFESETGLPQSWYWRQNVVGLYPAPDDDNDGAAKLRILYSYIPTAMSGGNDTTALDEWLDDAVVLFAVYRAYLKDRDFPRAEATAQEYSRALAEGTIKLNRHRKQHAPQLAPVMRSYRQYYQRAGRRPYISITTS
jgi:hypothetical protein